MAGQDGKQCSSSQCSFSAARGTRERDVSGALQPCASAPHGAAGVGQCGNATDSPRPRSVSSVGYPKLYPEHTQRNMLKGNTFVLYLV